ncbi:MAG: thiamine pyrophosphate-binding protein [Deltaproteobacteria bacterium]|nr:thiamine pyrophosphate-binding protein [Deltaproteobacteria bacterium]MBW2306144.1 thiamine pyrophosphate-binding protein [Deltaproteobacteria bacterium]
MKFTGGEAIVEILKRFHVQYMFGLPGDQTHIHDAIYRNSDIRHILVRHEQAAAHMADAYARASGKVGVCDATVGPGATNLISGIAEAFTSSIPVLALASEIRSDWRGRGCLQEIQQLEVFKPITKFAFRVDATSRIPEIMKRAFQIATTGKPGPIFLSIPLDILKGEADFTEEDFRVHEKFGQFPAVRVLPPEEEIVEALDMFMNSRKPILMCGGGVISSGAWPQVQELAETLRVPVVTTFMGKGSVPENHPLCLGPFGLLGRPETNDRVQDSDFILAVGTRFTNIDTAGWNIPRPGVPIVQVDIDPEEIGKNYYVKRGLVGDARSVLSVMIGLLENKKDESKRKFYRESEIEEVRRKWLAEKGIESSLAKKNSSPVHPLQVIRGLRHYMGPDDIIICDSGFNQIWGGQYFEVNSPGRTYMGPRGFGVMGFSLPAAIGAKLACPDRKVVALCGDGGFAMTLQELETAKRIGTPIIACIMNNKNLEYVKANQRNLYGSRFISVDFTDINFAKVAQAFGCDGFRVEDGIHLDEAFKQAFQSALPFVVDIRTLESAEPDRISVQTLPKSDSGSQDRKED